jgi:hypothetical protein
MIKNASIFTITLFGGYFIFVSNFAPKWWSGFGNDLQTRSIQVEIFLYNTDISNKNVILGSSLANRIIIDSVKNTYSLALGALGVFDGLYILSLKKEIPKLLFIEMNFIPIEPNDNFKNKFSNPTLLIKKYITSLQENKQPLVILGNLFNKKFFNQSKSSAISLKNINDSIKNATIFNTLFDKNKKTFSIAPSDNLLTLRLNNLAEILKIYQLKGTRIIFFEVPSNYQYKNLPYCKAVRDGFYNKFPRSEYMYIDMPENIKFTTSDGLHLGIEEAKIYSSYFKKQTSVLEQ